MLNGWKYNNNAGTVMETRMRTDREILGYSRYVVATAAFFAVFIVSPFEYAWSSMSGHLAAIYGWSHEQVAWLFTLFIILQSFGMLPGGMLRDKFGPRWTTAISGCLMGIGIFALSLGPSYPLVLALWCVGSFFAGLMAVQNIVGFGSHGGGELRIRPQRLKWDNLRHIGCVR